MRCVCLLALALAAPLLAAPGDELIVNGGFESGMEGWNDLWTREADAGSAAIVDEGRDGGKALRVRHPGDKDWSVQTQRRLPTEPGRIYELSGWVKVEGEGGASLCAVLYGEGDEVLRWTFAERTQWGTSPWKELRARVVIPEGATGILPRVIGTGPTTAWFDEVSFVDKGALDDLRADNLPPAVSFSNGLLDVTFDTATAALTVTDTRNGRVWPQVPSRDVIVRAIEPVEGGADVSLLAIDSDLDVQMSLRLAPDQPELAVTLTGEGALRRLDYPAPFAGVAGGYVIAPLNEGISYPVDDPTADTWDTHLYGGHGLCMAFHGQMAGDDGNAAQMTLVDTPDDARARLERVDGRLRLAPGWDGQKGRFGYPRALRYVFFDAGGYVAMCARYRQHAAEVGKLVTLAAKRERNPDVDKLLGAVNVWCWDGKAPEWCAELQGLGIERILWSNGRPAEELAAMNELGVLTSRYDIYQDAMNPAERDKLRGWGSLWTSEGWPHHLMIDATGEWIRGWKVRAKDDSMIPCGVLCDAVAPDYARKRIAAELATHPYRSRFIDTTTASPWRECYHLDHPLTRSESREKKMELLGVVSEEFNLVCGSETGHDASVPTTHYYEGMMSLGPYRVPDSGRDMARLWDEVPERVAKYQTGHQYRLPLWELVYHDCVVSQWYWGDYNNKLPSLWDRRDLINVLYGTPPMFMFNREVFDRYRDRFVQSYQTICPTVRAVAYQPMTDHRWLTADHAVQRSTFGNGVSVTVNFGDAPFTLEDGSTLAPLGVRVTGVPQG